MPFKSHEKYSLTLGNNRKICVGNISIFKFKICDSLLERKKECDKCDLPRGEN